MIVGCGLPPVEVRYFYGTLINSRELVFYKARVPTTETLTEIQQHEKLINCRPRATENRQHA